LGVDKLDRTGYRPIPARFMARLGTRILAAEVWLRRCLELDGRPWCTVVRGALP
jgi:hypothetical protein